MPRSSTGSSTPIVLEIGRSLGRALWWGLLGVTLGLAAAVSGLPHYVKFGTGLAVVVWAAVDLARRPARLAVWPEGRFAVLDRRRYGLVLGPGTAASRLWVYLDLRGGGERHRVLILRDQLSPSDWRALAIVLREAVPKTPAHEPGGNHDLDRL